MNRSTVTSQGRTLMRAFALLGIIAMPGKGHAQLAVDELEVFLRASGTAARAGLIRVTNDTDKPVQAMLEVQDWNRDDTGANQFHPLGTTAGSCGERVKVFPASVRIDAKRTESVRITYEGDAATSCWAVVFIQGNEPVRPNARQSQITYVIRTGVKVYVEPENALRQGDIDSVKFVQDSVEVLFRNSGKAHLKPTGAVEVRSADNQVVAKLDITEFPIAPGDVRRLKFALPKVQSGRYVALALLDYGGDEIAAAQLEFVIP